MGKLRMKSSTRDGAEKVSCIFASSCGRNCEEQKESD